ncbi:hypothetical protein KI387_033142, partial [Taxus chinensis]
MEASSFLFDVRYVAASKKLHKKQKKLLQDLGVKDVKYLSFDNIDEGKVILLSRLRSVHVRVILDDVDHPHAFLQPSSLSGFDDLVKKFVDACHGLPLSLKVLGAQLYGESRKEYWEGLLLKISDIVTYDVQKSLRVPVLLRELAIYDCGEFRRLPRSIGCLKHLRKIVVQQWHLRKTAVQLHSRVRNLPEEICLLQSLEHLVLMESSMSSLPNNFGHLTNLRYLDLRDCFELRTLPATFKQLTLLQHLDLEGCKKLTLNLNILENMTKLQYLKLSGCWELKDLPFPITNPASLGKLHLWDTRLRELPIKIGQLSKLREMSLGSPLSTSLPTSIGNLSSLTSLRIDNCEKLQSLPTSLGNLSSTSLNIYGCIKLEALPEAIGPLIHLQTLEIWSCPIRELDFGRGSFTSSLCNLSSIYLLSTRVDKISISQDHCPGLQHLQLRQNHHLTEIEELPTTVKHIEFNDCEMLKKIRAIGDLPNLETLIIVNCQELYMLPIFAESTGLKSFQLRGSNKVEKIEGLQHCTSLEKLVAGTCIQNILGIKSVEYMENLRTLQLIGNKISTVQPFIQTNQ